MASVSNLEKLRGGKPAPLTTRRFFSGLFTLRSPLNEPGDGASTRYYEAIAGAKSDALLGGSNMEVSNKNTLVTRPGFTLIASPGASTLGVYAAVMTSGTNLLYDHAASVWLGGTLQLYSKNNPGARARFFTIGNYTFISSDSDTTPFIWDGNASHAADILGIPTPVSAPSLALNSGSGMTAVKGWQYVFTYSSSKYTHVSTASPVSASTGPGTWSSITVSGPRSTDSAVDTVQIYRTLDGGSTYEFVGTVANPVSGNFSYTDTAHDSALNPFILAPQNGANNPPPSFFGAMSGFAYYAGRLWGAAANVLYFSGGPDTTNGNGLMAFPPTNYFQFPDTIQRIQVYSNGLLVFTQKDLYAILGTSTTTFYPKIQQSGLGVLSYFCVDTKGTEIYVFTSRSQFIMISPAAGVVDVGFPIGDQLASFPTSNSFVAYHTNGEDDAVYICDGTSQIYRMNPHQYPEGNICWSPVALPNTGCDFMASMYDTTNTPRLFIVDSASNVFYRDPTLFKDNGVSYTSSVTIGPIGLAMPGELASVRSVSLESTASGNRPTLSVLMNEISGSFTALPVFEPDPVELPAFSSFHSDRYYVAQAESGLARQMQVQIGYAADGVLHEILGYSVYGELKQK